MGALPLFQMCKLFAFAVIRTQALHCQSECCRATSCDHNWPVSYPCEPFLVRPTQKHHLQRVELREPDVFERPVLSWSSSDLTHVIFVDGYLPTLISPSPALTSNPDISTQAPQFANPPYFIHRHLRVLFVACEDIYAETPDPTIRIFESLHVLGPKSVAASLNWRRLW